MSMSGTCLLAVAFVAALVGAACCLAGWIVANAHEGDDGRLTKTRVLTCGVGAICGLLAFACLLAAFVLLAWCFLVDDRSLEYVVYYHSDSTSGLVPLYLLSGVWSGKEGSLLLWALLLAGLGGVVSARVLRLCDRLDVGALAVLLALLATFCGMLVFSGEYDLFAALPAEYLDDQGNLAGQASLWGLSPLLEHWAMAVHPPLLFVGYAGLAVPFSYAIASLAEGASSAEWMCRSRSYALVSWLFLTAGIGMGSIWAYSVLGWGGYWGWDAVENASLLPWLACVALVHSMIAYRRGGLFGRWSSLAAGVAFSAVCLDAFVTRSGLLGSVHAFAGDEASLELFLTLAVLSLGTLSLLVVWRARSVCLEGQITHVDALLTKPGLLFLNNVLLIASAGVIAYLTLAPALPEPLPFGGRTFDAAAYNAVAAFVGIAYVVLLAICQATPWNVGRKRSNTRVRGRALIACIIAFACFVAYLFLILVPGYAAALDQGGVDAGGFGSTLSLDARCCIAVAGCAAAACAFVSSVAALGKAVLGRLRSSDISGTLRALGAPIAHLGLSLILAGLVASSLFSVQTSLELDSNVASENSSASFASYDLVFRGIETYVESNRTDLFSVVDVQLLRGGRMLEEVSPSIQLISTIRQQQSHPVVVMTPLEDITVTFSGTMGDGGQIVGLDVTVTKMVAFIWTGFALLLAGIVLALTGQDRRRVHS